MENFCIVSWYCATVSIFQIINTYHTSPHLYKYLQYLKGQSSLFQWKQIGEGHPGWREAGLVTFLGSLLKLYSWYEWCELKAAPALVHAVKIFHGQKMLSSIEWSWWWLTFVSAFPEMYNHTKASSHYKNSMWACSMSVWYPSKLPAVWLEFWEYCCICTKTLDSFNIMDEICLGVDFAVTFEQSSFDMADVVPSLSGSN